jgi:glycosyltransferase involved in cell wall biosynthesis
MTGAASVVMLGDFDPEHPREKSVRRALDRLGVDCLDCRFHDEALFPGPRKVALLPYFYYLIVRRTWEIARDPETDVRAVHVTRFNPLVLPLAAVCARWLGCPLVYDVYVSLSATAGMREYNPVVVRATHTLERLVYRLPDHLLVGTDQLADRYAELYGVARDRFVRLPPTADTERFYPRSIEKRRPFTALYWGNFLPHHGLDTIADAARRLGDGGVEVVFLGDGPERDRIEARVGDLSHVRFEGYVPREELHRWIAVSHVALGVFSTHPRALASLTNKVCEAAASGEAILTERSPAVTEWFEHDESAYLVEPGDPEALAAAIRTLRDDPETVARLAAGARSVHESSFGVEAAVGALERIVRSEG